MLNYLGGMSCLLFVSPIDCGSGCFLCDRRREFPGIKFLQSMCGPLGERGNLGGMISGIILNISILGLGCYFYLFFVALFDHFALVIINKLLLRECLQ